MAEKEDKPKPVRFEDLKHLRDPFEQLKGLKEVIASVTASFTPADLAQSLKYLTGTVAILRKDTERCYSEYLAAARLCVESTRAGTVVDPTAHEHLLFHCRQTIRTFFAEVEGTAYAMKRVAMWAGERNELSLTVADIAVLREESYRFNPRKRVAEARPGNYSKTADSVVLAFAYLQRLFNSPVALDLSNDGWECFQQLLELRNNLTHPKDVLSLVVDVEVLLRILPRARTWFYESLQSLVAAAPVTSAP